MGGRKMSDTRPELSKKNKWWIPKHRYYELKHFCLQYDDWKEKVKYFGDKRFSGNVRTNPEWSDPVGNEVAYREYYLSQMDIVEAAAYEADEQIGTYILHAVTEDLSFTVLRMVYEIPCGKDMYYDRYRKFFYILDAKKTMRYIGRKTDGNTHTRKGSGREVLIPL